MATDMYATIEKPLEVVCAKAIARTNRKRVMSLKSELVVISLHSYTLLDAVIEQ
jgi:hypothetical protein